MLKDIHDEHDLLLIKWEKSFPVNIKFNQHIQILQKAILAVLKRTNLTLSSITINVLCDRILFQCIEKYSLLSDISMNLGNINFSELNLNIINHNELEVINALRFLLVEHLRVIERITAGILTDPLHQEILKVKFSDLEQL